MKSRKLPMQVMRKVLTTSWFFMTCLLIFMQHILKFLCHILSFFKINFKSVLSFIVIPFSKRGDKNHVYLLEFGLG